MLATRERYHVGNKNGDKNLGSCRNEVKNAEGKLRKQEG